MQGYPGIIEILRGEISRGAARIAVECYPGVFENGILARLREGLRPAKIFTTSDCWKHPDEIDSMVGRDDLPAYARRMWPTRVDEAKCRSAFRRRWPGRLLRICRKLRRACPGDSRGGSRFHRRVLRHDARFYSGTCQPGRVMRFKLIACEVLYRELCDAVASAPVTVDVEFVSKGLHDRGGAAMRRELQTMIDRVDSSLYSNVLLGYALCGNGLHGLVARSIPLVAPRAHDCIALLLGSRHRYQEYFDTHSGVYFRSTGWLERGADLEQIARLKTGIGYELDDLIRKYGEENGRYLFDELYRYRQNYSQLAFIETGLEPDGRFEEQARQEAREHNWYFEKLRGSLDLFRALVAGDWNSRDFLVVQPGWRIVARYDEAIIHAEKDTL